MLTLQQQTKILNFFCTLQAETFKEAECETVDFDGNKRDNYCENTVRIYDAMCVADIFKNLADTHDTDDDYGLSYTFNEDTVEDEVRGLDTEYRDYVIEQLMQLDDEISVKIYGKTFKQYCGDIEKAFKNKA